MISIRNIASSFENKVLPKEEWTHNAHLAVAFVELDTCKAFNNALVTLRKKIKEYNLSVGTDNTDSSGYHETLTVFWLTVVNEFYSANSLENIDNMYNSFTKTLSASSKFPTLFYSKELLFSKRARQIWVEPDQLPISEIRERKFVNMEQHFILSDEEFEDQFENTSLNSALFSHEAHIRLAWIHIKTYGETKAIENITTQLQRYLGHLGATEKYNETLTVAAVKSVNHFMQIEKLNSFYDFITACHILKTNFRNIIEKYYGIDIYTSKETKNNI